MKGLITLLLVTGMYVANGQKLQTEGFVRLVHVFNQNFTDQSTFYSPSPSAGLTLRYQSVFVDFGSFINKNDVYGFYSFYGSVLRSSELDDQWQLINTWFGEQLYLPDQGEDPSSWTHTYGINTAFVRPGSWGTIAIPLTVGVAYSEETYSLNMRIVLNLTIPIN